jgi:tRNA modification GTPase
MSLTEAESICALINAKTEAAALAARESLSGKMTKDLFQIDNVILKTRVQVEALLDFSDEDIETEGIKEISSHIEDCKKEILRILEKLETNKLLFETSKVAVIGKPNTGKSSLTNYLTDEEVSIVNTKAGTTRDVVSKMFSLNGAPVTILDTAGIRETNDLIEKEGKEKALKQAALANITLFLYDARVGIDQEDLEILKNVKQASSNILVIANKIDLIEKDKLDNIIKNDPGILCISIKENINMDILKVKILDCLKLSVRDSSPGVYNIKNIEHLNKAFQEINDIQVNLNELEVIAERLKNSQKHISAVLDNDDEERVLSGIFSNFCIGK